MYHVEVHSGGQVVGSPTAGLPDSCSFQVGSKDGEVFAWSEGVLVLLTGRESALQEERWMIVMRFLRLDD